MPSHTSQADVVIVGAGAAGLATAIFARRLNPLLPVLLLDSAAKPGAKILVSGGSRCNVTNARVTERDFFGGKRTIVRRVLRAMPVPETVAWFADMGVALHEEEHGKLFPDTSRSRDVLDALLREVQARGARLTTSIRVTAVTRDASGFTLETSAGPMRAGRVVLATGGQALPKSGSDGMGFEVARGLGHRIVPPTPALAPLLLDDHDVLHPQLSGVAHQVELSVWVEGAVAERLSGSLLWTHFGVSGPVVLDASRHWLRAQLERRPAHVTISFCPGQSFDAVDQRWTALAAERPRTFVPTALAQFIPASVAAALLAHLGIDSGTALAHFTRDDRRRLVHALLHWPLGVTGSRGYTYAEATAGGVDLGEINPATMESRLCPGLFLVGEILDVDGRIGGFNFQWAWASGRVAGGALGHR